MSLTSRTLVFLSGLYWGLLPSYTRCSLRFNMERSSKHCRPRAVKTHARAWKLDWTFIDPNLEIVVLQQQGEKDCQVKNINLFLWSLVTRVFCSQLLKLTLSFLQAVDQSLVLRQKSDHDKFMLGQCNVAFNKDNQQKCTDHQFDYGEKGKHTVYIYIYIILYIILYIYIIFLF